MKRTIKQKLITTVLLTGLTGGLLGVTGCVSENQYQRLQTAFDQAKSQLAADQNELLRLRGEISTLKQKLAEDEQLLQAQGGGTAALQSEIAALKERLAKLRGQYNKLLALAGGAPQLPASVNNALDRLAEQYPNLLEYNKKLGLLRFKSDLLFALGSTKVRRDAKRALAEFAQILNMRGISDNEIRIVGNTDNVPIRRNRNTVMNPTNWYLSTNRAISVMYILKHDGVIDRRMQVAGWGKTHPIAPNAPHHRGNALNRRVDIFILPIKLKYNPYVPASEQVVPSGNSTNLAPAQNVPNMTGNPPMTVPVPSGSNN
jgi:chemotaxis protein MotB